MSETSKDRVIAAREVFVESAKETFTRFVMVTGDAGFALDLTLHGLISACPGRYQRKTTDTDN